ncbi:MAG TPA: tetratricopeptide repeat protein [Streptosporangiaceae bacterium]
MDHSIAAAGPGRVPAQLSAARDTGDAAHAAKVSWVVAGAVPQRARGFQPRPVLVAQLNQADRGAPVAHVLTGPPGTGKTQVAAEYAWAKVAAHWRLVAWVYAGNAASLRAGLAAVAVAAGLPDGGPGPEAAEPGVTVRQLLEADGEDRLLVFDDVEDADLVRPFVPASGAAHVLITTRQSRVDLGTSIPVSVFSAEEARAFLDGRTGLGEAGAAAVAARLGYLPLALAQAAPVIAGRQLGYKRYLQQLTELRLDAHLSPEQERAYPRGAAESVVLALDAVQESDKTGVSSRVMAIMAVLSAAGVRRELLHLTGQVGALASGGRQVSAAAVDRALEMLAERSLLSFGPDGQTLIVHGLVTRVVREGLARHGQLPLVCRVAARVLEERADALGEARDRPGIRDILQQVAALLDNTAWVADAADQELADARLRLRYLVLSRLIELGDSAQAIAFGQELTADLERKLGRDHPDTLSVRHRLAAAYRSAGRPDIAIAMLEVNLAARERVLGADHPDTARTRDELAGAYRKGGEVARAIPLVEQILAGRERLLGGEHPGTLKARNNLAAAYMEAGRAAEAVPLLEQTLADCERLLGADDSRTVATRNNLARAREEAGQAGSPGG